MGLGPKIFSPLTAFIFALAAFAGPAAGVEKGSLEYAVKATFLYKFAPFVEWPPTAFRSSADPVLLCILGDDPFGQVLDEAVSGQYLGERSIQPVRLSRVARNSGCHILYILRPVEQSAAEALGEVRGSPVLTVTDSAGRSGAKGVVHFVIKNNRVRFHIDDQAAAENGIIISSKLLSLALSVKPRV